MDLARAGVLELIPGRCACQLTATSLQAWMAERDTGDTTTVADPAPITSLGPPSQRGPYSLRAARLSAQRCGAGRQGPTVRVADGEPGKEVQTDFGRMGIIFDPRTERRRVVHALIIVAVWSRFMYVWLTFGQRTEDVIAGLDAAWSFFGGVFPILIPDNLSPVVTKAEPTEPRFNDTFLEYAQSRGFLIDAARVRHPKDKPRVERQVPYVRSRFFAGEEFLDLAHAQRRADTWCTEDAGMRIHGTTRGSAAHRRCPGPARRCRSAWSRS